MRFSMETELASNLLALSEAFGPARKLEEATIGRLCASDGRFFLRIRDGKTFTVKKYDEVLRWFDANWPDGVAWPKGITRPQSAEVLS